MAPPARRCALALLLWAAGPAFSEVEQLRANDFPTVERVLFVEACAREHPDRPHTEMLYKCSCVVDRIARDLTFDEFVEASTAFSAGQAAGERGAQVRDSSPGQDLAGRFRAARSAAQQQCMLP